jgi:hypothetical protein
MNVTYSLIVTYVAIKVVPQLKENKSSLMRVNQQFIDTFMVPPPRVSPSPSPY